MADDDKTIEMVEVKGGWNHGLWTTKEHSAWLNKRWLLVGLSVEVFMAIAIAAAWITDYLHSR